MTTPSAWLIAWREKARQQASFKSCSLDSVNDMLGYWRNHEGEESKQHVMVSKWELCLDKK